MRDELHSLYFTREEVVRAGERAWAMDRKFRLYTYDGEQFGRRGQGDRYALLPAWRTPGIGWMHEDSCVCDLCVSRLRGTALAA